MIAFQLQGEITSEAILQIRDVCRRRYGGDVIVEPGKLSLGLTLEAASGISNMVAAVVAAISLCLQIRRLRREASGRAGRVAEPCALITAELEHLGVRVTPSAVDIKFTSSGTESDQFCAITISDKDSGTAIALQVSSHDDTHTIVVKRRK